MRTDFYVYVHHDAAGKFFYIGKGTGRRAWSKDRDPIWHHYVKERLAGQYQVTIVKESLAEEEALEIEEFLIQEYGKQLINWINPGRQFDYEAQVKYHTLRDATRIFVEETRALESTDLTTAAARYGVAMETLREYESLVTERGLVAELMAEMKGHFKNGFPKILDRLTDCLVRLGREAEAVAEAERYFEEFPASRSTGVGKKVIKRLQKFGLRVKESGIDISDCYVI